MLELSEEVPERKEKNASGHELQGFWGFREPSIEAEFVAYMHPKTIAALPVFFTGLTLLYGLVYLSSNESGNGNLFLSLLVCVISMVIIWPVHIAQRRSPDRTFPKMLACERWVVICAICSGVAIDIWFNFEHKTNKCVDVAATRVDQRRAFDEPQCLQWWSPFPVGLIAFMSAPQFIPFKHIAGSSVFAFLCHCVLWIPTDQPNMLHQVYLQAVIILAGLVFVCFVRYDHERTQRRHFLAFRFLQRERYRLNARQHALVDYCRALVPSAALRRLEVADGQQNTSLTASMDYSANGAVLVLDFHDFARWCTTVQPSDVAVAISKAAARARVIAEQSGADYVGSFADMFVLVCNLCAQQEFAATTMIDAAQKLVNDLRGEPTIPPVRCAAHIGELRGRFNGNEAICYDVFGDAFETVRAAIMEAPPDRVLVSVVIVQQAELHESPFESMISDDVNGAAFGVLRYNIDLRQAPSGARGSSSHTQPIAFALTNLVGSADDDEEDQPHVNFMEVAKSASVTSDPKIMKKLSPEEALQYQLDTYSARKKVWCCFEEFEDPETEAAYKRNRMSELPRNAARAFMAYAIYVSVLFALMVVDLPQPNGPAAIALLLIAIALSLILSLIPRMIDSSRMAKRYFAWSVVGTVMPSLVVFGAALSRPAAVGVDPRVYMLIGTLLRTYLFASARWLIVVVPITFVVNLLHLLLPGAHLRGSVGSFAIIIFTTAIAEAERERQHRLSVVRHTEARLLVEQLRKLESARTKILRRAVPRRVFELAVAKRNQEASLMAWNTPAGALLLIRTLSPSGSGRLLQRNKSLEILDRELSQCKHLDIGELFGDSAFVVGPVVCTAEQSAAAEDEWPLAFDEALSFGFKLCYSQGAALQTPATSTLAGTSSENNTAGRNPLTSAAPEFNSQEESLGPSSSASTTAAPQPITPEFSCLMEYDTVVHTSTVGEFASYHCLGASATRLHAISCGADPLLLGGFVVTDRVTAACSEQQLQGIDQHLVGPLRVRGAGIFRLIKLMYK